MRSSGLLLAILTCLALPLMAQQPQAPRWTISVHVGPGFGGPVSQLRDRMVQEQWTDQYCDNKQIDCHSSPNANRKFIQVVGAISRRLSNKLDAKVVVESGDLGEVTGAKGQYEITANWKATTLGAGLILHPIPRVRIGGGPLVGMLTRLVVPTENPNPIRAGLFVEGGIRSSERSETFLELMVSYRMLPRLREGPWPGISQSAQIFNGPSGIDANFSHFTVGLGAGVRF